MKKLFKRKIKKEISDNSDEVLNNKIEILKNKNTKNHLVVDDIESNRDTLKYYLESKGLNVDLASNGAEAVEMFSEKDLNYYDIIWMDIKMPFMDGIDSTKILRKRNFSNLIIMITGHINNETLLKCKMKGADKIYSKPIIKDELYNLNIFSIYYDFKNYKNTDILI